MSDLRKDSTTSSKSTCPFQGLRARHGYVFSPPPGHPWITQYPESYREHVVWSAIALDLDLATSAAGRVTSLAATFVVKPGGKVASMAIGARE